jgi:hypothetical protein
MQAEVARGSVFPQHQADEYDSAPDWADTLHLQKRNDPAKPVLYADARFAATHNSYEGGKRGSLVEQLDRGVRSLEFDVHSDDFGKQGFRLGHDRPGHNVARGNGNPDSDKLTDWLDVIANWIKAHPDAAPITLYLDPKDRLSSDQIDRLNTLLEERLGDALYRAGAAPADGLPTVDQLRGKVLAVLSGDEATRRAYRRDEGHNPAVAIDGDNRVIEVHDNGDGDLWYWAGELQEDGSIRWMHHGRYDTGTDPAIAMNDDGLIVEVHEDPDSGDDKLWYRTGRLNENFEIEWFNEKGQQFPGGDQGLNPSLRFTDRGALTIREVHDSQHDGDNFYWNGEIDPETGKITWTREPGDTGETKDALFSTGRDDNGEHSIEVSQGNIGPWGDQTLRYRSDGRDWDLIRYRQIMFVEAQYDGDESLENDGLWFYAGDAADPDAVAWAEERRRGGRLARLWGYNRNDDDTTVNFPAGDELDEDYDTVR